MTVFEIGKIYGTRKGSKIRIAKVTKTFVEFNWMHDDGEGNILFNQQCLELQRASIKHNVNGDYVKVGYREGAIESMQDIDEAVYKAETIQIKAAQEKAAQDEADRIANDPRTMFGKSIDFTPLFNHIREFTGHANLDFAKPELEVSRRDYWSIKWQSNEINLAELGVFGRILKSCIVAPFSNQISIDKDSGECRYWTTVHIHYEHKDGGSNGMDLFTARFEKGEWIFQSR